MSGSAATARGSGLLACRVCHLLTRPPMPGGQGATRLHCPRCGSRLHSRKPASISRTWALVCASLIFYFPANLLPITRTTSLGKVQVDTIMSGVIYFIREGSWYIALIIFIASILVPLAKLVVLVYLLLSVQGRAQSRLLDRARLYRFTEVIGRWSMVDIFAITILVALVRFGAIGDIEVGPAALFFGAVVVLTMLAAASFDPRLLWDAAEKRHDS